MKYVKVAVALVLLVTVSLQSLAAGGLTNRGACPMALQKPPNPWRDAWRQYFLTAKNPYVSIRFDAMPVADALGYTGQSDPLGTIWTGACYSMKYEKKSSYWTGGWAVEIPKTKNNSGFAEAGPAHSRSKIPADPADYKMAIRSTLFTFNEAGEVYHEDYGLVGHMYCTHLTAYNACHKYAQASRHAASAPAGTNIGK